MMIKYGITQTSSFIPINDALNSIRMLFERVISLKLKPKKMKLFFQKYIDFEKKFGEDQNIANIKRKAQEYVDKIDFKSQ